jgi:hypothetical protein
MNAYAAARLILCSTVTGYTVMGTACKPTSAHDPRATHVGTVDLELEAGGPDDISSGFGRVSGLAFDSSGRIIVADAESARIFVYTRTGKYPLNVAPDSTRSTWCCVTLHDGLVWILDRQGNTYEGYGIADSSALPRERIVLPTPATWLNSRVSFDTLGRLIHVSDAGRPSLTGTRELRQFVARAPGRSRLDTLPVVQGADLNRSQLLVRRGAGQTLFRQPFGAAPLHAFGPKGEYAYAVSSRYDVSVWSADLRVRRMLTQHVPPAGLSWSERRSAAQSLAAIAGGQRVPVRDLPFGIPEHRPALERLMFDLNGRLWVVRSVQKGRPHLADVYDADGRLIGLMSWPAHVSLELGAIRDSVALGTTADPYRGERVVRLTFRRRVSAQHGEGSRVVKPLVASRDPSR